MFDTEYQVNGTTALKPEKRSRARAYSMKRIESEVEPQLTRKERIREKLLGIAYSSEMFCSLTTEDVRGVKIGGFTKRQLAVSTIVLVAYGSLCIFLGV